MTPEALRRRMAHGNIYAPEKVDAALANYFRVGNLGALRELALMWVADRSTRRSQDYREAHGIARPWETRERVVVAVTGAPGGDDVIRRAARMAMRSRGELIGVHVRSDRRARRPRTAPVWRDQRQLLAELGGEYREVVGRRRRRGAGAIRAARERDAARARREPASALGRVRRGAR